MHWFKGSNNPVFKGSNHSVFLLLYLYQTMISIVFFPEISRTIVSLWGKIIVRDGSQHLENKGYTQYKADTHTYICSFTNISLLFLYLSVSSFILLGNITNYSLYFCTASLFISDLLLLFPEISWTVESLWVHSPVQLLKLRKQCFIIQSRYI